MTLVTIDRYKQYIIFYRLFIFGDTCGEVEEIYWLLLLTFRFCPENIITQPINNEVIDIIKINMIVGIAIAHLRSGKYCWNGCDASINVYRYNLPYNKKVE